LWIQGDGAVLNFNTTMDGGPGKTIRVDAPYIYSDNNSAVTITFNGKINNCDVRQPLFYDPSGDGYKMYLTKSSEICGNLFTNTRAAVFNGKNYTVDLGGKIDSNTSTGTALVDVTGTNGIVDLRGEISNNVVSGSILVVSGGGVPKIVITLHQKSVTSFNTVSIAAFRQYETTAHFDIYGEVSNNNSLNDNGGGFYLSGGTAAMYGTARVTGNTAYGSGGGFYINQGAALTMYGGEISGNTAQCKRGSIPPAPLPLTHDQNEFGVSGGGGVAVTASAGTKGSVLTMYGGVIKNNTSALAGGGVIVTGRQAGHTFILEGGAVTGNFAKYPNGVDIAVGAGYGTGLYTAKNVTSALGAGYYVSIGKSAVIGNTFIGSALYSLIAPALGYDNTGVLLLDRPAAIRLGNISDGLQTAIAGRVNALPGYAGYAVHNSVWYSIDKTAGKAGLKITHLPGTADPNDYEWIAVIQPLGAMGTDLGVATPASMKISVPQRTANGLTVSADLLSAVGGDPVDGYAVVIMCMLKSTDLTLDVEHYGNGEFYIDSGGGAEYHATMSVGDTVDDFVILPATGWKIRSVVLTAGDGAVFDKTADAIAGTLSVTYNELARGKNTIRAVFEQKTSDPSLYIIATSDAGSTITPEGAVAVSKNSSRTFQFSAVDGNIISAVTVDGTGLTPEQIGLGYYTFFNIVANHTISVSSIGTKDAIILTIDVVKGKGHAKYGVNGGLPVAYTGEVLLTEHWKIAITAYADEGYSFKEWKQGASVFLSPEMSFDDVVSSIHLDLYFADDGNLFWLALFFILLLLILGLLILFLLYKRKKYDVFIPESSSISGKDAVRRKDPYRFEVEGSYSGAVSYRVREDGEWKLLLPNEDGTYVVPKQEVIGDIYLEIHP
jgi:hypothetical protein